jgi:hypothetical protein
VPVSGRPTARRVRAAGDSESESATLDSSGVCHNASSSPGRAAGGPRSESPHDSQVLRVLAPVTGTVPRSHWQCAVFRVTTRMRATGESFSESVSAVPVPGHWHPGPGPGPGPGAGVRLGVRATPGRATQAHWQPEADSNSDSELSLSAALPGKPPWRPPLTRRRLRLRLPVSQ